MLRYREDLITSKVAQLHCEETLRSEILFLKDQVLAEQQEKSNLEDTLTAEIRQLHDNLGWYICLSLLQLRTRLIK